MDFSEIQCSAHSASEALATMRYMNWCFTYLLTYGYGEMGVRHTAQRTYYVAFV